MDMCICASANSKYVRYLYIMLISLLQNNKNHNISVYVFQRDFTISDEEFLTKLFIQYGQKIIFIFVNEEKYSKFPEKFRYTLEAYFRFEILSKIPKTIDRVLYLDVDMIVQKDISELFQVPLDGYYFAACQDMMAVTLTPEHRVLFNRFDDLRYFNSGMMIWNLEELRKMNITFDDFFDSAKELNFNLPLVDQDILNYKFYDKVFYLDAEKYNYMVTKYVRDGWNASDINNDASILHFTGISPWSFGPKSPIYKIWWKYAKKTPFYVQLLEEQLELNENNIFEKRSGEAVPDQSGFIIKECIYMMLALKGTREIKRALESLNRKVVIWGGGYLGKCFCDLVLFENAKKSICSVVDNRRIESIYDIPLYQNLNWISREDNYFIIITPSYDYDKIKSQIASSGYKNIHSVTLLEFLTKLFVNYKNKHLERSIMQ